MRYLLLLYDEGSAGTGSPPPSDEEFAKVMGEYNAFTELTRQRGVYLGGEALQPVSTATTVRRRDDETITTDGPFMETKEGLGGYYLLDCRDLDEALELAALCPGSKYGSVEVRPIWEIPSAAPADSGAAAGAR